MIDYQLGFTPVNEDIGLPMAQRLVDEEFGAGQRKAVTIRDCSLWLEILGNAKLTAPYRGRQPSPVKCCGVRLDDKTLVYVGKCKESGNLLLWD